MAISDDARRLAVADAGLTVLTRDATGDAWSVAAKLGPLPVGGTGKCVSWSPSGELLAYTAAGRATIFDASLCELSGEDMRSASDADFASTGALVVFGDWSSGRVLTPPQP